MLCHCVIAHKQISSDSDLIWWCKMFTLTVYMSVMVVLAVHIALYSRSFLHLATNNFLTRFITHHDSLTDLCVIQVFCLLTYLLTYLLIRKTWSINSLKYFACKYFPAFQSSVFAVECKSWSCWDHSLSPCPTSYDWCQCSLWSPKLTFDAECLIHIVHV